MDNFTFYNPTRIIFGKDTVGQIGGVIKEAGLRRVLLVAGGGSIKKNGVYDTVVRSLSAAGVAWVEAWGVRPNPVLAKAQELIALAKHEQVDAVLAVGGGSVIDTAKSVAAGVFLPDLWAAFERQVEATRALPIFVVLTMSGTGSEMNPLAVLTHEADIKKWVLRSPALFPQTAIIDPTVQYSLPWHQTVNGAIDALTHVMEFYFVGTWEETTMALDESLMRTIISMTQKLQQNPVSYEARANLAWAASLALNGLTGVGLREGDFATHRIQTAMSAVFPEIAHGAGLSVLFPAWILYMKDYNTPTFVRWARNIWEADSVEAAVEQMRLTFHGWDASITLGDLGVSEADIPAIVAAAQKVGVLGKLRELTPEDIDAILHLAL
jgi:alcohol dehydrogenase YqhD (iron-dependent ADH family)